VQAQRRSIFLKVMGPRGTISDKKLVPLKGIEKLEILSQELENGIYLNTKWVYLIKS
jgi:hypothetical protein